jgi:phosphoribosylformimino-5-aminoimidazole carboxamide ribotide isomerase
MELIPAIDIRGGRCVRLLRGDFDRETRYDFDPVELAVRYRDAGARWLHVVDLDGAKRGQPQNLALVEQMRDASGLKIQLGGGLRTRADVEHALSIAERAVIGSLAVTEPTTVGSWLDELGWARGSAVTLAEAVERYLAHGLRHVLCTDIDRDGALGGPNLDLYSNCVRRWPDVAFVASGGVRDARDLAALARVGVAGAVSGKALLEGTLTPEEMKPFLPAA